MSWPSLFLYYLTGVLSGDMQSDYAVSYLLLRDQMVLCLCRKGVIDLVLVILMEIWDIIVRHLGSITWNSIFA